MSKMSLAQWQAVIDVNLTGVFLCTREVAAKMVELKNSGAIINISSISRAGNVGQTNYSAAKAGVAAATVTWAKEQIGRAHVCTPVTNAHRVCRLRLAKNNQKLLRCA